MYYRIKSRRLLVDNIIDEPLTFCTFINDERLLLLFKNGSFLIVDPALTTPKRITYQDNLYQKQTVVDCKRVKTNVCALLTTNILVITFVMYVSDQQTIVGDINAPQMELLRSLSPKNQLIMFSDHQFLVHSQCFYDNSSYFTIFNQTKNQFNYDINSKSFLYPTNFENYIIKALPLTTQIACYKQRDSQTERKVLLIRLSQQLQNQQLDLSQIITQSDSIADIIAKSEDQYSLFINRQHNQGFKMAIYNCKVTKVYGKYSTNFSLYHHLSTEYSSFISIIDVNSQGNYFLTVSFAQIAQDGQIFDNFLELRDLQTFQIVERVACNLKILDFSPSKLNLVDYSQQIDSSQKIVLHIRTLFTKKYLYAFLLNSSQSTQHPSVQNIHQLIISLL